MINFDLHLHSSYSYDCLISPDKLLKIARKNNLDVISITDHDSMEGSIKAKKIAQKDVSVIVGTEIKTDYGDVIGLFMNDDIKSRKMMDVLDEIRSQDGIIVYPHPYRRKKFPGEQVIQKMDVIESINGRNTKVLNDKSVELADRLQKPSIAGSDAHFSFEYGRMWNVIEDMNEYNEDEFRKNLLLGNVKIKNPRTGSMIRKSSIYLGTLLKILRK